MSVPPPAAGEASATPIGRGSGATLSGAAPPATPSQRLERLAAARLDAMLMEAEAHPGGAPLSTERLRELQTLAALVSVRERLETTPASPRWPAAAALALTLVAVSTLLFVYVPQTEIELDATASEVTFTLAIAQALTEPTVLRFIGIAGFDTLAGSASLALPHQPLALAADATDANCTGVLTLDRLILPRAALVDLRRSALPQRVHLSLKAPGAALQITLDGCVRAGGAAGPPSAQRGVRTVTVVLGGDEVDLDLESIESIGFQLAPFVRIRDLSLSRIEYIAGEGTTLVRRVSTVNAGTVFLNALDGQPRVLRFAEPIRFERADGELRSVKFDGGEIALRFHGAVRGMVSGSDAHLRSWMPTWLEWLKANHGVSLFWAAATSAFGLLMALLKWWKPTH